MGFLNAKKKKKVNYSIPKSVQQSIPYAHIMDDGIIETEEGTFTRSYKLEDVNFKIAPDNEQVELFKSYGDFLNSFSADTPFQILIHNHAEDKRKTLDSVCFKPQRDNLNKYRQEMNTILLDKIAKGKNNIKQDKYLVVAVEDNDAGHAKQRLDTLDLEIDKSLRRLSREASVKHESTEDRLRCLHDIYNQKGESIFDNCIDPKTRQTYFDLDKVYNNGLSSKDVVGSSGLEFKTNYFKTGNTYGRVFYMKSVANWVSTDFISDITDLPFSLIASIHHQSIDSGNAIRMVKNHLLSVEGQMAKSQKGAARDGISSDLISPSLSRARKQTQSLMTDLISRDQKLYNLTFLVTIFADTKDELDDRTEMLNNIANKALCPFQPLLFQQEFGFDSTLPLCLNKVKTSRLLTTESSSVFIPFTSQELTQKNGIYYGLNQTTKNVIMYDKKTAKNYNSLIFGESGGGKSFFVKQEMFSVLLRDPQSVVYVVDPEGEYGPMGDALGAEVVELSPGSQTFINPLDLDINYSDGDNPLSMKTDYVISLIEIMLGKDRVLDPTARSILGRCVDNIYRGYIEHLNDLRNSGSNVTNDPESAPTLANLYHELLLQEEPEAKSLASVIEIYAVGQLQTFAHRTNIDTTKNFVIYDINKLGSGMKDLALFVCLNDIWMRMISNGKKGIYTRAYIDEFYLLLQSDSASRFLMQLWKRCRKFRGMPVGIMQNVADLMRSEEGRAILTNTSFISMLSLSQTDREALGQFLSIPDSQLDYIANAEPGHGLIYTGKTVIPFDNSFPENNEMYRCMSTKDMRTTSYAQARKVKFIS